MGASVRIEACDFSKRDAVKALLDSVPDDKAPVGGEWCIPPEYSTMG